MCIYCSKPKYPASNEHRCIIPISPTYRGTGNYGPGNIYINTNPRDSKYAKPRSNAYQHGSEDSSEWHFAVCPMCGRVLGTPMHFYPSESADDTQTRSVSHVYLHGKLESKTGYDLVRIGKSDDLITGVNKCTVEGYDGDCTAFIWNNSLGIEYNVTADCIVGFTGLIVANTDKTTLKDALQKYIASAMFL